MSSPPTLVSPQIWSGNCKPFSQLLGDGSASLRFIFSQCSYLLLDCFVVLQSRFFFKSISQTTCNFVCKPKGKLMCRHPYSESTKPLGIIHAGKFPVFPRWDSEYSDIVRRL